MIVGGGQGYIMPGDFRRTIRSELRKQVPSQLRQWLWLSCVPHLLTTLCQDVHFQSKRFMQNGVKQNKNQVIPFECMLFGR